MKQATSSAPPDRRPLLGLALAMLQMICALGLAFFLLLSAALAQEDDADEGDSLVPGLVARYTGSDGRSAERCEHRLAMFCDDDRPPAPRLAPGAFQASWQGLLLVRVPGSYRLRLHGAGKVKLALAGRVLIDAKVDKTDWLSSEPVELEFGYQPLEVHYEKTGRAAQLALYWSGPGFACEPVAERWLFHKPQKAPDDRFEHGASLARALRCGACHAAPERSHPLAAPALNKLRGAIERRWLVAWLAQQPPVGGEANVEDSAIARRMPYFSLSEEDAGAVAAYLLDAAAPAPLAKVAPGGKVDAGSTLFHSLGCLACHRSGALGSSGLLGGGDLTAVARKRPPEFFAAWLKQPAALNQDHRMPIFKLSDQERLDLAAYLATCTGVAAEGTDQSAGSADESVPADDTLVARGKELVARHRCGACHRLPSGAAELALLAKPELGETSKWDRGCTSLPGKQPSQPGFALDDQQQAALRTYFSALPPDHGDDDLPPSLLGERVLREHNCTACHQRGLEEGLGDNLAEVAAAHPDLAPILPALSPPALDSVGDKLYDKALRKAIAADAPRRPWLAVRMPKFDLNAKQRAALIAYLIQQDRVPELPPEPADDAPRAAPMSDPAALALAGRRLVTADGFGCTSCHTVAKVEPVKVELKSRGPELAMLGQRIRRAWYDRWMRNPARLVPRMEMPAVQVAVRGVLEERIDEQLAAVWHILNQPDFTPPDPLAVRVVRRQNLPGLEQPAITLTDNLEAGKEKFFRPLLFALPNRHNVLFDLESYALAGWSVGDAARQRTRGKYWYWEAAGTPLVGPQANRPAELVLLLDGKSHRPLIDRDFPAPPDYVEHVGPAVGFEARLTYQSAAGKENVEVRVAQQFYPIEATQKNAGHSGFRRRVHVSGLPAGAEVAWCVAPGKWVIAENGHTAVAPDAPGATLRLVEPHELSFSQSADGLIVRLPADSGEVSSEVAYLTELPVDRFLQEPPALPPHEPQKLDVVPGFEAVRLPLPEKIMPIALAWRGDGRLLIGSLKGRLWQARDTDGDALEDEATALGPELVQPYGIATVWLHNAGDEGAGEQAAREAIDVVDKFALVRLHDRDGDDRFEGVETLAAGWGHKDDYHGWVVGLPRDRQGNYFVALSQQGGPAAHLRGRVLRLYPAARSAGSRFPFAIESLTVGHRFPAGIALSRAGELFVTDNQGEYNPFNELNRVVPGSHYGFVSKQDPLETAALPRRGPVVAIPHPWTRSVNGICFLETPPAVREKLGHELFGPWEGHLVGCEYDTRRLIRISLQKVGDRYQGAAYPLSVAPPAGGATFLGPITCQLSPEGDLYVGGLRDSAYGAGNNTGEVVRLHWRDKLPAGIAEMRATDRGFTLALVGPIDRRKAADPASYALSSFRRISTPAYGGPDHDRRDEKITEAKLSDDGLHVELTLGALRAGFVYELRVKNLAQDGGLFHPAEAYYSVGPIPQ